VQARARTRKSGLCGDERKLTKVDLFVWCLGCQKRFFVKKRKKDTQEEQEQELKVEDENVVATTTTILRGRRREAFLRAKRWHLR